MNTRRAATSKARTSTKSVPTIVPSITRAKQYASIKASTGERNADARVPTISLPSVRARCRETLIPANAEKNSTPAGSGVAAIPTIPGRGLENRPKTRDI